MSAALDQALAFLHLGLSVIPVPPPRPGVEPGRIGDGKVPAIAWRDYQTRLPTEDEIRAWFGGAPMNLAIVTGAVSGIVVVDADAPEAVRWATRRLTYTPWQVRTSRGYHLYYRTPEARVPNRARIDAGDGRLALDLRGDGGYVIAPPSVHRSGAVYRLAGDWTAPRSRVPVFWPGWLARPDHERRTRATRRASPPTGDLMVRARRYLAALPRPIIGSGSDRDTLYAACRLVRGFGLPAGEAERLLWEWAGGRPGWTRAWIAEKVRHAERYGTEPLGALR